MQCWLKPFNIENLNFVTQNGKETNWMGSSQIYRVFYFHMMYNTRAEFLWFLCSFVASFFASKSGIGTIRPGIYGSATALWHSWPDINQSQCEFSNHFFSLQHHAFLHRTLSVKYQKGVCVFRVQAQLLCWMHYTKEDQNTLQELQ